MSRPIRISASRLKTLWDCSLKFHYQEIERLPSSSHWKTRTGSCLHSVFECLMHPRRRATFERIMVEGVFRIEEHPAVLRYINWYRQREDIMQATVEDIVDMLNVAFLGIRPYFTSRGPKGETLYTPPPRFVNEHRFQITLSSGAVISGFIDLLLVWPDRALVIDLKSQAAKMTRAELPNNVQAAMYQMVTSRETGLIPAVEFIMVRHGPTSRTPDKHVQRVDAPSAAALAGLEAYIDATYSRVNAFSLEDAYANASTDTGYCQFKCSFLRPFTYWIVCGADDPQGLSPLSAHLSLTEAQKACYSRGNGSTVSERRHKGCALRWNPNQNTAS